MSKSTILKTYRCIILTCLFKKKNMTESSEGCEIWQHFRGHRFILQSLINRGRQLLFFIRSRNAVKSDKTKHITFSRIPEKGAVVTIQYMYRLHVHCTIRCKFLDHGVPRFGHRFLRQPVYDFRDSISH